jgi:hypothetical protein
MVHQCPEEGLQMADNTVHHFSEVNPLMDRCLIFEHEMRAVMAPYKEKYKNMQKRQSNRGSPLSSSHLSSTPPCLCCLITLITFSQES